MNGKNSKVGRGRIYVVHAIDKRVLYRAGDDNQIAINRAMSYLIRRHALGAYLAMRRGDPPTACEPMRIMVRTGRPLRPGQPIAPAHGKWRTPQGGYTKGAEGPPPAEVVSVLPAPKWAARCELERRYPKVWAAYCCGALVCYSGAVFA